MINHKKYRADATKMTLFPKLPIYTKIPNIEKQTRTSLKTKIVLSASAATGAENNTNKDQFFGAWLALGA